ncbi:MAG: hypothetical protein DSM106950_16965 [Stigonema ocellatum SAG 48.90 = DSM 106950]|nr:hypothetical protein [Stigonema ocellatum SAG 48.90 = DSM 106950]
MADSIYKASNFVSFTQNSNPGSLTNVNGIPYFAANDGTTGTELWRINSSGNAELVSDIYPRSGSSDPGSLTNFNTTLYFRANDGTNGDELWKINSSGDAEQVADFNLGSSATSISKLTAVGDKLYVTASDGNAFQIWLLIDTPHAFRHGDSVRVSAVSLTYPTVGVSHTLAVIPVGVVPGLNPLGIDNFRGVTFPQSGGRVQNN